MPKISDSRPPDHSLTATNARAAPPERDEIRFDGTWKVHVDPARYLALPDGCPHAVVRLLLVLEVFARTEPFCWPSNQLLAQWMGLEARQLNATLKTAVDLGCVAIVDDGKASRHRLAIVLLRRLSGQAAAETPEALRFVRDYVLSGRHRKPTEDPQRFWSEHLGHSPAATDPAPRRPKTCDPSSAENRTAPLRKTAQRAMHDPAEPIAENRTPPLRGKPRQKNYAPPEHDASNDHPSEHQTQQQREREIAAAGLSGPKTRRVRTPKAAHRKVAISPDDNVIPFEAPAPSPSSAVLENALARLLPPQLVAFGLADAETRDRVALLLTRGDLAARKSAARLLERFRGLIPNNNPAEADAASRVV